MPDTVLSVSNIEVQFMNLLDFKVGETRSLSELVRDRFTLDRIDHMIKDGYLTQDKDQFTRVK